MPKLAANLSMLFAELPFLDRFDAAAQAGFRAVEFQFPYAFRLEQIADALQRNDLQLVLHNLPAGNWESGERGIACHPDRVDEFRSGVEHALRYATALKAPQVNCLAGIVPEGVSHAEAGEVFVQNLRHAAAEFARHGIKLLVEPINTWDIPGFFLHGTAQAIDLIARVGSDNLYLQYDAYHMQRMEGELAATIERHLRRIAHIQIADTPGRHEPGTGEINYRYLFQHLDAIGYAGWVGCEYKPRDGTLPGLAWRAAHGV
jgi:hydroxypyruvate isomerase